MEPTQKKKIDTKSFIIDFEIFQQMLIMFFFPTKIWDTLLWGDIILFIFIKHYIRSFLFFAENYLCDSVVLKP
jgi:hypothetical protein